MMVSSGDGDGNGETAHLCQNDLQSFQHEPLDHSQQSIRLIKIKPELSTTGLIQCSMEHAVLPVSPRASNDEQPGDELGYSCLSYTWGDRSLERTIIINGKSFLVHENLWDFLNMARCHIARDGGLFRPPMANPGSRTTPAVLMKDPLIWIDAICIDQVHIEERNHQVQLMASIYRAAEMVIIWLGTDPTIDQILIDCYVSRRINRLGYNDWPTPHEGKYFWLNYWRRAWIVQEVILAQQAAICLMSGMHDFDYVHAAMERRWESWRCGPYGSIANLRRTLRLKLQIRPWPSLLKVMSQTGTQLGCLDVRDRIYSVLGLCAEGSELEVDYSLSQQDLMRQVLIVCRHSLCFCHVGFVAQALEVSRPLQRPDNSFFFEFDAPATTDEAKCSECVESSRPLPSAYVLTHVLCLQRACCHLQGHIVVPRQQSDIQPPMTGRIVPKYFPEEYRINGVVELPDLWVVPAVDEEQLCIRWRLGFEALFTLAQYIPEHTDFLMVESKLCSMKRPEVFVSTT